MRNSKDLILSLGLPLSCERCSIRTYLTKLKIAKIHKLENFLSHFIVLTNLDEKQEKNYDH